jgi:UDP-N-acetylmuramoylalanine--D-glutamate ligase
VEHRLEPVATIDGITYYNDSKATNPDAAISALVAFDPRKVVLIAGGRDKKSDLSDFVASVKAHVTDVVLLGEAADRFSLELQTGGFSRIQYAESLEDAVQKATVLASPEVPVLFSPACASFDMFKNFEERGQVFKSIVQHLPAVSAR